MNPIGSLITKARLFYTIRFARRLCRQQGILFPYSLQGEDADIVLDIFYKRLYAPCFPFYKDCTILDIGAHKGYFSLFAARYAGRQSKIYAIEPEPGNFSALVCNAEHNNCGNITAFQNAIADVSGKRQLFLSRSVNHSMVQVHKDHPYIKQMGCIDVDASSLKDFLNANAIAQVEFLKIDCEGAEYDILFAADDATLGKIQTIALEFHDIAHPQKNIYELSKWFAAKGFKQVALHFQETPMPLAMGVVIVTR